MFPAPCLLCVKFSSAAVPGWIGTQNFKSITVIDLKFCVPIQPGTSAYRGIRFFLKYFFM